MASNKRKWHSDKWHTDDILDIRPDLTITQANEVLEHYIDRPKDMAYEELEYIASDLFGDIPENYYKENE